MDGVDRAGHVFLSAVGTDRESDDPDDPRLGEVTERSFARMAVKPDWGIYSIPADDGRDHMVSVEKRVVTQPSAT